MALVEPVESDINTESSQKKRLVYIDVLRGWAILMMIVFHLFYDLNYFQYIDINFTQDLFWVWFRYVIVVLFLLTVGMSLKLAYYNNIDWVRFRKRIFVLFVASLLVSVGTYVQFTENWVYFGILHFIFIASIMGLPFLNYPHTALVFSIGIFLGFYFKVLHMKWLFSLLVTPLNLPQIWTIDLVSFIPWFSFVLLGIVVISYGWHHTLFDIRCLNAKNRFNNTLSFMGGHALFIYLVHIPVLFGIFMSIDLLLK